MGGLDCSSGLATTPRSSRTVAAHIGRVLRSRNKQKQAECCSTSTPKISSFFQVRKRMSPSKEEKSGDSETETVCKRFRRHVSIGHLKFVSPELKYPGSSPDALAPSPITEKDHVEEVVSVIHPRFSRRIPTELGIFESLPTHVVLDFLDNISALRLVDFSVMSQAWSRRVSAYLNSKPCRNRFISACAGFCKEELDPQAKFTPADPFFTFGALLKSTTVYQITFLRISTVISFCESVKSAVTEKHGWGRFFNTICERWAFSECARLLEAMLECFDLHSKINEILSLTYTNGDRPETEMEIRATLRALFVDPVRPKDDSESSIHKELGFWHSCLLRTICRSPLEQARILLIMYAPTVTPEHETERIDYRTLVDGVVGSWDEAQSHLRPLASALYSLLQTKKLGAPEYSWSENEIFNLTEEITSRSFVTLAFPEPWAFDNFVVLHMHWTCLIPISLCARIRHGYTEEAGNMVNSMKTMLFRWRMDADAILRTPLTYSMATLNRRQKRELYDAICAAHTRQCADYQRMGLGSARDLLMEHQSHFAIKGLLSDLDSMSSQK